MVHGRFGRWRILLVLGALAATAGGCGVNGNGSPTAPPGFFSPGTSVLVAAGDIASCPPTDAEATAKLLDGIGGTVITLGDNAYPDGTTAQFAECYAPTWGRHRPRTRPSPGNHDYGTAGAAPYFAYFGDRAGPAGLGYYSFDIGNWHVISLNSNVSARSGSAQEQWLRADLAAHRVPCTLAYWHHPLFSSGDHGYNSKMLDIWRTLYEQAADVVLNGHDHDYERFAPQSPDGLGEPARGIREFVVGTGGKSLRRFAQVAPNSEVRIDSTYGVLRLDLSDGGYAWSFIATGGAVLDSGAASCVG